jgi:hypothetical protein
VAYLGLMSVNTFSILVTRLDASDWQGPIDPKNANYLAGVLGADIQVHVAGVDLGVLGKRDDEVDKLVPFIGALRHLAAELEENSTSDYDFGAPELGTLRIRFRRRGSILSLEVYIVKYVSWAPDPEVAGPLPRIDIEYAEFVKAVGQFKSDLKSLVRQQFEPDVARGVWDGLFVESLD